MSIKVIKDLCARKDVEGREKPVWSKVGSLLENDKGVQWVELSMHPDLYIAVFERQARENTGPQPAGQYTETPTDGDDVPF